MSEEYCFVIILNVYCYTWYTISERFKVLIHGQFSQKENDLPGELFVLLKFKGLLSLVPRLSPQKMGGGERAWG